MLEHICNQLMTQRVATLARIGAIPEAMLFVQPAALMNHPAWTLGHLRFVDALTEEALGGPAVDPRLMEHFGTGSRPSREETEWRRVFGDLPSALEMVRRSQGQALERARTMTAGDLAAANRHAQTRDAFPTPGDLVAYLLWHEGYHAGQVSQWRRAMGIGAARTP